MSQAKRQIRRYGPFPESTKMNGSSTAKLCIAAISWALEDNSFRKSNDSQVRLFVELGEDGKVLQIHSNSLAE